MKKPEGRLIRFYSLAAGRERGRERELASDQKTSPAHGNRRRRATRPYGCSVIRKRFMSRREFSPLRKARHDEKKKESLRTFDDYGEKYAIARRIRSRDLLKERLKLEKAVILYSTCSNLTDPQFRFLSQKYKFIKKNVGILTFEKPIFARVKRI